MKVVLLDLGRTLEHQDVLLPGAAEMLAAIKELRDVDDEPVVLGLVSDFDVPHTPADIPIIRQAYYSILDSLGIRAFFEPVSQRITLSTDVGVFKPDERIFRAALDKLDSGLPFTAAMFVTENLEHVAAARALGMRAVHFKGPGQSSGDISRLLDLVAMVQDFIRPSPVPTAVGAWSAAVSSLPDTSWVRFGNDIFLFGAGSRLRDDTQRVEGAAWPQADSGQVLREHLHLVIQKGRLFQKAHPDVHVLLDRGRFLLVVLDPRQASRIGRQVEPCYTIRPVNERHVAFEVRSTRSDRRAELSWVRALVDGIIRPPYEADLAQLTSFATRHSTSPQYEAAADWTASQLESMGYQTEQQTINVGMATSRNVIGDRTGSAPGQRSVVIVTAHLDSVNHDAGGGPSVPAPGADDNASGSAGVLQIARSLRDHPNQDDLRFILFGGEEQGLLGSRQYVAELSPGEKSRVRAVVNMDMIGCLNRNPASVLIEGGRVSEAVIDGLASAAGTYTGLVVETSLDPFASDHVTFIDHGLPAVLTIEGADQSNPNDHTGSDVIGNINFEIALEILRMNLAFVAKTIGHADGD